MEVGNFVSDGVGMCCIALSMQIRANNLVTEGEPASQLLNHILHQRLGVDPTEHPLMITEPAWNTQKAREMLTEMVFEGEKMPALYFGSQGVTSA